MTSKRSVFVLIAIVFVIGYSATSYYFGISRHNDNYDNYLNRKTSALLNLLKFAKGIEATGSYEVLNDTLDSAKHFKQVDFFIIKKGDEVLHYAAPNNQLDKINANYVELDHLFVEDNYIYASTSIGQGKVLTMGIVRSRAAYLIATWQSDQGHFIKDLVVILFFVLAVVFFFFRDILKVLKLLREKNTRSFKGIDAHSKEAELLIEGLASYEQQYGELQSENQRLIHQLLPSLRSELLSGKKPPYTFQCTLVRTDINNFSSIFNTHPVEDFMHLINQFFIEVSHTVSRYKGYVAEFIGDEVIFYFKDEDHENSAAIAIAALEQINKIADSFDQTTHAEHGFRFRVKSSLSVGTLRFGPQVNGHSLAGAILIETVRILSEIHEKDDNTIYFGHEVHQRLNGLVHSHQGPVVRLKGIPGEFPLYICNQFLPIKEFLANISAENIQQMTYYRNDDDVIRILKHLLHSGLYQQKDIMLKAADIWRQQPLTKGSKALATVYKDFLIQLRDDYLQTRSEELLVIVPSMISCAPGIVAHEHFDNEFVELHQSFIEWDHVRITANIVESFSHFGVKLPAINTQALLGHPHNRVMANAIIRLGKEELNGKVLRALRKMMTSPRVNFQASGLFALGELTAHYIEENLVYLNTNSTFKKLIESIPEYFTSENEMVVRQALLAAKKSKNEALTSTVIELIKVSDNKVFQDQARLIYAA